MQSLIKAESNSTHKSLTSDSAQIWNRDHYHAFDKCRYDVQLINFAIALMNIDEDYQGSLM